MSDSAILYWGMFCFALALIGMSGTVYEFKKMSRRLQKRDERTSARGIEQGATGLHP